VNDGGDETRAPERARRTIGLAFARFDEHVAARGKPLRGADCDSTLDVETVVASVKRDPRLVVARLLRHEPDLVGGNVWRIDNEDVDPASQCRWQRVIQVALVNAAPVAEVGARAQNGRGFDVSGVQLNLTELRRDRDTDRTRAAAQVDNDSGTGWGARDGFFHEKPSATPGHKNPGRNRNAQTTELSPPHDLFERKTSDAQLDHSLEVGVGTRGLDEYCRLVFRENTACGAKPCD
jgi:hypothetical protein